MKQMAMRVQNAPKKIADQSPFYSMSHFSVNCPSWWNSHEQQIPPSLSKDLSLKVESQPQPCPEKKLGLQRQDQDSSSTQSTGQSYNELTAMGGTNSQDQCISSESVQEESYGKHVEGPMKPVFFMGNPDLVTSTSQIDPSQSINRIPYAYADPYCGGLFTAYGPPTIIQPQMVGMTPARVPLPLELAEDGPIYVNAKQYHAILRRRQTRAKLEAQNKLVKTRRPYLHESRHQHAVNRVRGSGGRFLSMKKLQPPNSAPVADSQRFPKSAHSHQKDVSEFQVAHSETGKCGTSIPSCAGIITSVTNSTDVMFEQQPDRRFSAISTRMGVSMQDSRGLMCNGTRHRAPVVR